MDEGKDAGSEFLRMRNDTMEFLNFKEEGFHQVEIPQRDASPCLPGEYILPLPIHIFPPRAGFISGPTFFIGDGFVHDFLPNHELTINIVMVYTTV